MIPERQEVLRVVGTAQLEPVVQVRLGPLDPGAPGPGSESRSRLPVTRRDNKSRSGKKSRSSKTVDLMVCLSGVKDRYGPP